MEGAILGLSGPQKRIGSLCCGIRSKKDNSILNNGTTADGNTPDWWVSHHIVPREKSRL